MEYIWKSLSTKEQYNANVNDRVVTEVHWALFLRDGQYMVETQGTTQLGPVDIGNFVPFANLNNDQIMNWVKTAIGNAEVANRINYVNQLLTENQKRK